MFVVSHLVAWLGLHLSWFGLLAEGAPFHVLLPGAEPTPTPTPTVAGPPGNAADISTFFTRLTTDLTVFALAMAGFFFALAALFYMASGATGNERARSHAVSSLYAALAGLALALLAVSIATLVNSAATGQ